MYTSPDALVRVILSLGRLKVWNFSFFSRRSRPPPGVRGLGISLISPKFEGRIVAVGRGTASERGKFDICDFAHVVRWYRPVFRPLWGEEPLNEEPVVMRHVISALVINEPGVLASVAG